MSRSKTGIFISSTCYDLAQIRNDVREFADVSEYTPILSESNDFVIDPDLIAIENCFNNIKNSADIYVLIIGNRYGSIHKTGKSVTNLEYREAVNKGIPIYIFLLRDTEALYQAWKSKRLQSDPKDIDNLQLFEFIDEIYASGNKWIFRFEFAQEIISTLKKQISYLLADCIDLKRKLHTIDPLSAQLSPQSLKVYAEKPRGWEFLLIGELLRQKVREYSSKKLDLEMKFTSGAPILIENSDSLRSWVADKMHKPVLLFSMMTKLVNEGISKAVGASGEPGDLHRIIHITNRISDVYKMLLDWMIEFNQVLADEEYNDILERTAALAGNSILEIEDFMLTFYTKSKEYIDSIDSESGAQTVLELKLTLSAPQGVDQLIEKLHSI